MGMKPANPRSQAGVHRQAPERRRRPGALIFGCLLMAGAIAPLLAASPAAADPPVVDCSSGSGGGQCDKLTPTLDCVWVTSGSSTVTAVFGYSNDSSHTIVANVGPGNLFSPAPADRGQPTSFPADTTVANAFTASWSGGSATWTLPGGSVTASSSSPKCSSSPMPAIAEAGVILGCLVIAVFFSAAAFRERGVPRPARLLDRILPR